jgi:hypothetical protein
MKKVLFIYLMILFSSCNNNTVQKPDHLLDKDIMENILYDVSILQATYSYKNNFLLDKNIKSSEYIFKKYNIDSTTYIQNYKYYASDIKSFKKMYKRINEKIENEKIEIDSAQIKGKKKFKEAISNAEIK